MSRTSVIVEGSRVTLRHGRLRGQRLPDQAGWTRVALIASTALLLGGDAVRIDVEVGRGGRLELLDIAGTVAYDGRGLAASWEVCIRLGEGASLIWAGEPLVLAEGSEVERTLELDLADKASALIREIAVFGRAGEVGGSLRSRTRLNRDQRPVLIEDQHLDRHSRHRPGILDGVRVMETIFSLGGHRALENPHQQATAAPCFELIEAGSWMTRYLGSSAAESPLIEQWPGLRTYALRAGRGFLGSVSGRH